MAHWLNTRQPLQMTVKDSVPDQWGKNTPCGMPLVKDLHLEFSPMETLT